MKKHVLVLAIGFLPNIGGLETHLKDLIDELIKKDWQVTVLTYQPLNTPVLGKWIEKTNNLVIFRLPIMRGVFYKLLKTPVLEFLFLEPLLFLATSLVLLRFPEIGTINGQGLIAGFAAAFWAKIFRKRYVISVQSVYHFPGKGIFRQICKWIFHSADKVIAISKQAKQDIQTLEVEGNKIIIYTNWENSKLFTPVDKKKAKEKIGFTDKFVVSFFGRLVEEKGVSPLLEAIKLCDKKITFAIYGEGPLLSLVLDTCGKSKNVIYMKTVPPEHLPLHYSAADIVIMPSLHEEGFGRVAAGALLCGTPVIASNRGALPEVVNDSVGKVINPTSKEAAQTINFFYNNQDQLRERAFKSRKYAIAKFSNKNSEVIIETFS